MRLPLLRKVPVPLVAWPRSFILGTEVLAIGDRNQLPPINGGGYFTNRTPDFSLMAQCLRD
jgi:hypothetical protein